MRSGGSDGLARCTQSRMLAPLPCDAFLQAVSISARSSEAAGCTPATVAESAVYRPAGSIFLALPLRPATPFVDAAKEQLAAAAARNDPGRQ